MKHKPFEHMKEITCFTDKSKWYWCDEYKAEIDRLTGLLAERDAEIEQLRRYEDAVTSAVKGTLLVWNLTETNCAVIDHKYWIAHLEEIEKLKQQLTASQQEVERLTMLLAEKNFDRTAEVFEDSRKQTAQEIVEILLNRVPILTGHIVDNEIKSRYGLEG